MTATGKDFYLLFQIDDTNPNQRKTKFMDENIDIVLSDIAKTMKRNATGMSDIKNANDMDFGSAVTQPKNSVLRIYNLNGQLNIDLYIVALKYDKTSVTPIEMNNKESFYNYFKKFNDFLTQPQTQTQTEFIKSELKDFISANATNTNTNTDTIVSPYRSPNPANSNVAYEVAGGSRFSKTFRRSNNRNVNLHNKSNRNRRQNKRI